MPEGRVIGRRGSRMVIYDIPRDKPDDKILAAIIAQNFGPEVERDSFKSQLRLVFKFSNRRATRDRNHWMCEVTPELRKNLMERLFVEAVGWMTFLVSQDATCVKALGM